MKPHVITIAGALGSGKSSTANGVAHALGYRRFSAGDLQRATATSLGLTYDKFQQLALADPAYDRKTDDTLIAAGKEDGVVIDSRLGYHFIPDSFKVFLTLTPEIAATRILKDSKTNPNRQRETAGGITNAATIAAGIRERFAIERERYQIHYGITDYYDPKYFNIIIDTAKFPLDEVIQKVVTEYKKWSAS